MRRLVALLVGAGLVLCAGPAGATPRTGGGEAETAAREVLDRAVRAGRSLDYTGTQYVASWRHDRSGATLADVTHRSGQGAVVSEPPTAAGTSAASTATAALDPRLVSALAAAYDLRVSGTARCTGRTTSVVEARRDGRVAGRFWVDRDSGLLLRREVYDEAGRRVRSSAFVDLDVRAGAPVAAQRAADRPDIAPADLRARGWEVPESLPHGFRLFETRLSTPERDAHVLHLAYSDGLSSTSLFAQSGRLGTEPPDGFVAGEVGQRPVWVRSETPERRVWSGGGHVWTLVSDAPPDVVRDAVAALPRDPAPRTGLLRRLGRGLARLASLLNPFG